MSLRGLLARPEAIVVLLALAATASGLGNGFVYDDVPIILQNPVVRHAESVGRIWSSSYWPAGLLYRPLTIQMFALQWAAGGGSTIVFHAVSVLLMMLVALLFWRLARQVLPPLPALVAGALFAVHPVHAESVANVVGQAELMATALILLAVERYLVWRGKGPLGPQHRAALALLTLLAIFSKETGYVIPALFVAAEIFLMKRGDAWRSRVAELAPVLLLQAAAVAAAILVRVIVLGPTPGAGPATALRDLPPLHRMVGMLAVVPEWARLLLWPAHLLAEYSPPGVAVTAPFGVPHALGLALLVTAIGILVLTWRRHPVIAFGLGWVGIALFPVSNVLTTTGVILAERTLFLPSAGAMLALGGILALVVPRLELAKAPVRNGGFLLIGTIILAGVIRSVERQLVWKEQAGFIRRLAADATASYRAHLIASNYYSETGRYRAAERAAARAYELFKEDPQVYEQYGQTMRRQGRCDEALPVLSEAVERFPDRTVARSRLIECALALGDTARARELAREAVRIGQPEFERTVARLRASAPPTPLVALDDARARCLHRAVRHHDRLAGLHCAALEVARAAGPAVDHLALGGGNADREDGRRGWQAGRCDPAPGSCG